MATDTLRIGIIGAGANTRSRHICGLRTQNSVEIVGVANRSLASSEKAAKELDIPKKDVATGPRIIVRDKTIDAVCIGTAYTHAEDDDRRARCRQARAVRGPDGDDREKRMRCGRHRGAIRR